MVYTFYRFLGERIMDIIRKNTVIFLTIISLFIMIVSSGFGQYQLYRWVNFEKGRFPEGSVPFGENMQGAINVVEYSKVSNMPRAFHSGIAGTETGRYGLWLKGDPTVWVVGLADSVLLDRDRLGSNGRALYQADFYLPESGKYLPSLAVLAMEPLLPNAVAPQSFYRFGFTKNTYLYFSHVVADEEEARIYVHEESLIPYISRPGWHRFAIVFEGRNNIRCYIDGHEPKFSPVDEPTLRRLQVGIMLAEQDFNYTAFVDNLSIQWTPEDAPIPESPYASTWGDYKSQPTTQPASPPSQPLTPQTTQIGWLDPNTGWQQSKATGKPMMVFFHAPRVAATQPLNNIFQTNPQAQAALAQYISIKINVNQYQGGELAKKFRIFKVPTIVILNSNGQETSRGIFGNYDTWQTFSNKLRLP